MEIQNPDIQIAFIHILIDAFNKGSVDYPEILTKDNEVDDTDDYKKFYSFFDFDADDKDRISLKDINAMCKERGLLFQSKKIKQLLINKGMLFKKTNKGIMCFKIKLNEDYE